MKIGRLLLLLLLLFAARLSAQSPKADTLVAVDSGLADVLRLVGTMQDLLPYYDSANHFTMTFVYVNPDSRFIRVQLEPEVDQMVKEADWYLDYFAHHDRWDITPLVENEYVLRVMLRLPKTHEKSSGQAAFSFTPEDMARALAPPIEVQARTFVAGLARHMNSRLPHAIGDGEVMAGVRYDSVSRTMTTVYEYDAVHWPQTRDYVLRNLDRVRKDRAAALVMDTANHLAFVSYKGGVTLRHVYCDVRHTDSVEMVIEPWMWETVFENSGPNFNNAMARVRTIADEVKRQCPSQVDGLTRMVDCRLDTVARRLTYVYELAEVSLQNLEENKKAQEALRASVYKVFTTTEGRRLAEYMIEAGVSVEYKYVSAKTKRQHSLVLSTAELRGILGGKDDK